MWMLRCTHKVIKKDGVLDRAGRKMLGKHRTMTYNDHFINAAQQTNKLY